MGSFCAVYDFSVDGISGLVMVPDGSVVVGVSSVLHNPTIHIHVADHDVRLIVACSFEEVIEMTVILDGYQTSHKVHHQVHVLCMKWAWA
jgi:hypothetical protein